MATQNVSFQHFICTSCMCDKLLQSLINWLTEEREPCVTTIAGVYPCMSLGALPASNVLVLFQVGLGLQLYFLFLFELDRMCFSLSHKVHLSFCTNMYTQTKSVLGLRARIQMVNLPVRHRPPGRTCMMLVGGKGRVPKYNSALLTRRSSMWKLLMGACDTENDHLSGKHPAVLESIPLEVPMVHF